MEHKRHTHVIRDFEDNGFAKKAVDLFDLGLYCSVNTVRVMLSQSLSIQFYWAAAVL